jgi:hypothetical protein
MNSQLTTIIRAGRGYRHPETVRMATLFFLKRLGMTLG